MKLLTSLTSLLRRQESSDFISFKNMNRHWLPVLIGMTSILAQFPCFALETPHFGLLDKRVRHINYQAEQVIKLVGHYGFTTDIAFDHDETVKQIAMGDSEAWSVTPVANHLFIKPKAQKAITNMTILTNKRVYHFELSAHWSQHGAHPIPNDMMFAIDFRYPEQLNTQIHQQQQHRALRKALNSDQPPHIANSDYSYKGDASIKPVHAFDDGRFTYITFNPKQDFPAVYIVNADDSESIVNSNVNPHYPQTLIIRKVVRQLVLRQGTKVVCLFNQGFKQETAASYQTSNINHVKRVIKGEDHD